jgi:hypothetical protein
LRVAGAETDPCMFWIPWAIAVDNTDLFIIDNAKHRILRRNKTNGNYVSYLGNGQDGWNTSTAALNPPSLTGHALGFFNSPRGIIISGTYFYVADELNHRIVRMNSSDGKFDAWIGNGSNGWKNTWTGPASSGTGPRFFQNPSAIAADSTYLYIADRLNNRISRWEITTGNFAGWLGHGKVAWETIASAPASGPYQGVSYYPPDYYAEPQGLAYASGATKQTKRNYLYVTSVYNGRVTRINLDCASLPGSAACEQLYDPFQYP